MDHDIPRLLAFADTLADAARTAILPFFRAPHAVDNKSDKIFDPVTEADRACEQRMRQLIGRGFPDHAILGEEFGEKAGESGYQWILDPIDGTRAFVAGLPTWGVLIGLYYEGAPLIGVMDQPYLDERYRGFPGGAESAIRGATRPLKTALAPRSTTQHSPAPIPPSSGEARSKHSNACAGPRKSCATASIATPIACLRAAIWIASSKAG